MEDLDLNLNLSEYEKSYKYIFDKTNLVIRNILKQALESKVEGESEKEIEQNNNNENNNQNITIIKKLLAKKEILNYDEYINKYIFLIPEFFIYYIEEKLKNIIILNTENEFFNIKSKEIKQKLTIDSIVEKLGNSNILFELTEKNLEENEEKLNKNKENYNNKIKELQKEIEKTKNEYENIESKIDEENDSFKLKSKEIIYKMNKILHEDLKNINEKINEIKESKLLKENEYDIFFKEFDEFKINFINCYKLFKEKNTLSHLEIFNFQFLLNTFEKKEKEISYDLENIKKEINVFLKEKNMGYNKKNIKLRQDLLKKISSQEEINNNISEEIKIMRIKEEKLISDIRKKKDNFLSQREKLGNEDLFFQIKNRNSIKIKFILIIILIFVLYLLIAKEEFVKNLKNEFFNRIK
jgi:hypothetical protein